MVTSGQLPAQHVARWVVALVDGDHAWGSIHSSVDRRGTTSYLLVVFPPGLSAARRRRIRLCRAWPTIGLLMLLPTLVVGHALGSVRIAFAVVIIGYLTLGLLALRAASPERARVREFCATDADGVAGELRLIQLDRLVDTLAQAEIAHNRGRLDDDGFHRVWSEVHEEIGDSVVGGQARRD